MKTPKGQVDRDGVVSFGDARLGVCEEGIPSPSAGFKERDAWELAFKRQVFARIIQALNRLGWTVTQPSIDPHDVKRYGGTVARWATERRRDCSKGDLKGELKISGRCIEFEMWQGVNTPTRPDHGGRYERDKEACMPYVLRLEMERTRRRIRDYLCNVFSGYTFKAPGISSPNPDPLAYFNDSWDGEYERRRGIHRFDRGPDGWPSDKELGSWGRKDGDGVPLNHGDVRWWRDHKGRLVRGRVYGGINGMWMMVYGPGQHDHTHQNAGRYFTYRPGETPRKVVNKRRRRERLEGEMAKAVKAMDFRRAEVLKGILWPTPEPLFHIMKGDAYFAPNYCGYRSSPIDAGKYTQAELKPYADSIRRGDLRAVQVSA